MVSNLLSALSNSNSALLHSQYVLSTGKTVNHANDNIANYSIARRAETSTNINRAINGSIDDVKAMLQNMTDSLQSMYSDASQIYELTLAAQSGQETLSDDEIGAYALAALGIAAKWNDVNLDTYTFNGNTFANAGIDLATLIVNEGTTSIANGTATVVFAGGGGTAPLGWGADIWDSGGGMPDRNVDLTATGLDPTGTYDILAADPSTILATLNDIRTQIARYSAWMDELTQDQNNNSAAMDSTEARRGRMEDTDIAAASVDNTKKTILHQISTAQLAAANTASRQILALF